MNCLWLYTSECLREISFNEKRILSVIICVKKRLNAGSGIVVFKRILVGLAVHSPGNVPINIDAIYLKAHRLACRVSGPNEEVKKNDLYAQMAYEHGAAVKHIEIMFENR